MIVCDIDPGVDLVCFNHFFESKSAGKRLSYELNIPESVRAMKDNFCGDARREARGRKCSWSGKIIKPLYPV
jgi:hypothetical protein